MVRIIDDDSMERGISWTDEETGSSAGFTGYTGHLCSKEAHLGDSMHARRERGFTRILILHEEEMVSIHRLGVSGV